MQATIYAVTHGRSMHVPTMCTKVLILTTSRGRYELEMSLEKMKASQPAFLSKCLTLKVLNF